MLIPLNMKKKEREKYVEENSKNLRGPRIPKQARKARIGDYPGPRQPKPALKVVDKRKKPSDGAEDLD